MKKITALFLSLITVFALTACGNQSSDSTQEDSADAAAKLPSIITITVPFNAGSNTDSQMRFIQPYLEKHLGSTIVVNNAGGASGVIGTTEFLTQKADGSNILFSLPTPTVYKPAGGDTPYSLEDLIPVSRVSASPFYLAVSGENEDFPDGASVLEYIKANPGKFTYANAGNGGIAHLAFASFLTGEDLDALSVPFAGGTADEYTAVMGGHVMSYSVSENELLGRSDVRTVLNLGSPSSTPGFEDVPTLEELGYEGYVTDTFAGFYYMKGVDEALVGAFDAAVKATLEDEEFLAAAEKSNFGVSYASTSEFTEQVNNTAALAKPVLESIK